MHCVVSDMIDYNRLLGKEFRLSLEPIRVHELIEELQDLYQDTLATKQIEFKVNLRDKSLELHSDR